VDCVYDKGLYLERKKNSYKLILRQITQFLSQQVIWIDISPDTSVANSTWKDVLLLLGISEMQIKTTRTYHFMLKCWQNVKWHNHFGK
jgi:hypothetical protein